MKKLPINEKPFIRPYTENLFIDSIMNNNMTVGNCVAKVYIDQMSKYNWDNILFHSSIKICKETETVTVEHYSFDSFSAIYRSLSEEDIFVCRIDYQQYTNRWDSIVIGIDNCKELFCDYSKMLFTYGNYCSNDMFSFLNGDYHLHKRYDAELPIWIKVVRKGKGLKCLRSMDGIAWETIFEYRNINFKDNCLIGMLFCLNDNQYDKWLANNFIQLKYNRNDDKHLEYVNFPKRDWRSYTINPVVKISYDNINLIEKYGLSLWEYIKANIDSKHYLEFWLDEFYVDGLTSYQKFHYSHESLVYGYDESSETIFMMSIFNGKPKLIEIKLNDFLLAQKYAENNTIIYKFEYNPTDKPYELDIFHIREMLTDYLAGANSLRNLEHILPSMKGIYGIKIYDEIINNEEDQDIFLQDRRIAYLLAEHKKCMVRRIEYLAMRGYLKNTDYIELITGIKKISGIAKNLLCLVIKNILYPNVKIQKILWSILNDLKSMEEKYYSMIVDSLVSSVQ